jgi:hypothetical protein
MCAFDVPPMLPHGRPPSESLDFAALPPRTRTFLTKPSLETAPARLGEAVAFSAENRTCLLVLHLYLSPSHAHETASNLNDVPNLVGESAGLAQLAEAEQPDERPQERRAEGSRTHVRG